MLATPASKTLRASGGSNDDSQSGMRGIQGTMQASGKGSDVMSTDGVPVGPFGGSQGSMFSDQERGGQQYPMPGTPATNAATSYLMVSFGGRQNHMPGNQRMGQQHYPVTGTPATTAFSPFGLGSFSGAQSSTFQDQTMGGQQFPTSRAPSTNAGQQAPAVGGSQAGMPSSHAMERRRFPVEINVPE